MTDHPIASPTSRVSTEDANAFLHNSFGASRDFMPEVLIMELDRAVLKLHAGVEQQRPGGFISGPTQMALADSAAYFAIFTRAGLEPMAMTTNLSINFLSGCKGNVLIADGRLLKIGKTLAVVEVDLRAEGADRPASHAVATFALPRTSASAP